MDNTIYTKHNTFCRYHYSYNTGLQAQSVLYSQGSLEDEESILLDPNKLSDDGTVGPPHCTISHVLLMGISQQPLTWTRHDQAFTSCPAVGAAPDSSVASC